LDNSQALKEAVQTIKEVSAVPCYGVAYVGDESVIVLPGFNEVNALSKAEELGNKMNRALYLTGA